MSPFNGSFEPNNSVRATESIGATVGTTQAMEQRVEYLLPSEKKNIVIALAAETVCLNWISSLNKPSRSSPASNVIA